MTYILIILAHFGLKRPFTGDSRLSIRLTIVTSLAFRFLRQPPSADDGWTACLAQLAHRFLLSLCQPPSADGRTACLAQLAHRFLLSLGQPMENFYILG